MKNVLLGMLLTLATVNAVAQEATESTKTGLYIGIGSTGTVYEIEEIDDDATVGSLSLKFGYAINKNVAIEARFIGESDDDNIQGADFTLDSGQAVYLRLSLGNPTFDPYILLGYAKLEATVSVPETYYYYAFDIPLESSGSSVGIGANWNINETISLTGDWTVPEEDTVQFNLGLDIKF